MLTKVPTMSPTVSHLEMMKPSNDRPDPKAALKFLAWATESVPTSA
jgi:hypothetical protein